MNEQPSLSVEDLVFVDEAGVNRAMTRRYGRSPRGQRAYGEAPRNYGRNVTLLGALTREGITASLQVEMATTREIFEAFVAQILVPVLRPGQVVLMDNLSAHKRSQAQAMIEAVGARVLWLPRYSPELNPIELAWSKTKAVLRKLEARTEQELDAAITQALASITASDARGYFEHAGYRLSN